MDKKITCNEGTIWNAKQIAGYIRENGRLIGRTSMINTERSQREIEMIEEYAKEYHQSQLQALKDKDKLGQVFMNKFDCYNGIEGDGQEFPAMTKDKFVEVVSNLITNLEYK